MGRQPLHRHARTERLEDHVDAHVKLGNKDVRDVARGSNTAVFEYALGGGLVEARYLIIDWGATMGKWGSNLFRSKWDAAGYEAQTPGFVTGIENGFVQWSYLGQRTAEAREQISVADVCWLTGYIGRITDAQLRDGLGASGATPDEIASFTKSIRARLDTLKLISESNDERGMMNGEEMFFVRSQLSVVGLNL